MYLSGFEDCRRQNSPRRSIRPRMSENTVTAGLHRMYEQSWLIDTGVSTVGQKRIYDALLYDCFKKKGNNRSLGIVRKNLDTLRDWPYSSFCINLCGNLSAVSRIDMARTGHDRRTPSGWNQLFDNKLLISGIPNLENMFYGFP